MKIMEKYLFEFKTPAEEFCQGLPIGNGKLGATVLGRADYERIVINDETLYGRYPKDENNYGAIHYLQQIRDLIFAGRIKEAEEIIESEKISGTNTESYLALSNLYLDFGHKQYSNYFRRLNLDDAVHTVEYVADGITYTRESFVSAVSGALTMRFTADKAGKISFALSANSVLHHHCHFPTVGCLMLTGKAPDETYPKHLYHEGKATGFEMLLQVLPKGGEMKTEFDRIVVKNADEVVIHVVTDTGYIDYNLMPEKDPHTFCQNVIEQAVTKEYAELKQEHISEYQGWFKRVSLDLGEENRQYELYFQFARYVLISFSRPNNQAPANLQGIWSEDEYGDWACAYTLNLNLPMNYWIAETTGLSELTGPLFRFIHNLSENGKKTAKAHYGCEGWCCHHNVGLYCKTTPFTNLRGATFWGMWPVAGVWLCQHLWEHYLFTLDINFLRDTAYPIMKGAAQFCKDFLCEHEGYLVSCPTTSPEILYYDEQRNVCGASYSTTMDICLMHNIFDNCIEAAKVLRTDVAFALELADIKSRLHPFPINNEGRLQEFIKDYEQVNKESGHVSPLYGLYPANVYSKVKAPNLFEAAKKFFEYRKPNFRYIKDWCPAWHGCIEARLGDGEGAAREIAHVFSHHPYPLFVNYVQNMSRIPGDTRGKAVCQIDVIMGAAAGITEMLLQSQDEQIEILPAIPKAWNVGSYKGLCARGGITVSAEWKNDKVCAELISKVNQEVTVIIGKGKPMRVCLQADVPAVVSGELMF